MCLARNSIIFRVLNYMGICIGQALKCWNISLLPSSYLFSKLPWSPLFFDFFNVDLPSLNRFGVDLFGLILNLFLFGDLLRHQIRQICYVQNFDVGIL